MSATRVWSDRGWSEEGWYDDEGFGEGFDDPAPDEGRLIEEFFTSDEARRVPFDDDQIRLVEAVLRFSRRHRYDPLALTPMAVEVLLLDWVSRELGRDGHYLAKLPQVLGSFIAFGHRRREVPPSETITTLVAVTTWTFAYWEMLEAWRFQRSADRFGTFGMPYRRPDSQTHPLRNLAAEVGGLHHLENLDTEPLPDEDFDRDALPADIRARADAIRELAEGCCAALLDHDGEVEHRTALRRLLRDVACGDPRTLVRGRDDTAAAALCMIIGKANAVSTVDQRAVSAHLGLASSPSSRVISMRRAAGLPEYGSAPGSTRYLTGATRRRLVERRDRLRGSR